MPLLMASIAFDLRVVTGPFAMRCLSTAGTSIHVSRFHSGTTHSGIVGTRTVATIAGTRSLITPLVLRSGVIGLRSCSGTFVTQTVIVQRVGRIIRNPP